MTKCRQCDDAAVARFGLSRGCVVYPNDRRQALCAHHAFRATPLGSLDLIEDFTVNGEFGRAFRGEKR
jgi:hypothetical protein